MEDVAMEPILVEGIILAAASAVVSAETIQVLGTAQFLTTITLVVVEVEVEVVVGLVEFLKKV